MRRLTLLCAAALLLLAPTAARAVPGDAVAVPISPPDGATVLPAAAGVPLVFACPSYRQSPSAESGADSIVGYAVEVASDPAFTQGLGTGGSIRPAATAGQCTAVAQQAGGELLTEPGTYYWRVSRLCFCGASESEVGPTASFTIRAATPRLQAVGPRRAYAGYTSLAVLKTDLPDGQEVTLERKAKAGWEAVGEPVPVIEGQAVAPVTLRAGRAQLRWGSRRGTQLDHSKPLAVLVVAPRSWSTDATDVGSYRGSGNADDLTFQVVKDGREIKNLRARLTVYCIGGTNVSDNRVISAVTSVKRIRIAPDGSFYAATQVSKTDTVISGRLHRGKVTSGRLELSFSLCSGSMDFEARRH